MSCCVLYDGVSYVKGSFLRFCRKAQESQREMKLLLDMYRSAPKEQRDKVQLMAAEKKSKSEVISVAQCRFLLLLT